MAILVIKSGTTAIAGSTVKGSFSYFSGSTKDLGPTSSTGFYSGIDAPAGGYTVYRIGGLNGWTARVATDTTSLDSILISYGATGSTLDQRITWATNTNTVFINSGTTASITPTQTPTQTITPSMTVSPTVTPTSSETPTPTPTITPTASSVASYRYYYGTSESLAHDMTNPLTNVTFNGGSGLCDSYQIGANEIYNLTPGGYYTYDSLSGSTRGMSVIGFSSSANLTGSCSYTYGRYRVSSSINGVCTLGSYTGATDIIYYNGSGMCDTSQFISFGSNQLTGLTTGTYYLFDTVTTEERQFTNPYSFNTLFYFTGSCSTQSCTGRTGYYLSSVLCDAVTGGTQLTGTYFYVGPVQGPMCDASSGGANEITGLTAGTYYIYEIANNKAREITTYGGAGTSFIFNGSCSTPSCGGGRSGYYYATTRAAAISGGTQVNDVTFTGGDMCTGYAAVSNSFSSLSGYVYLYNADNGNLRQYYGSNSSSMSAMSACVNANNPVYYYSSSPNDCFNTQTFTNLTFNGGANICSATGFNANEVSSLNGTYYLRSLFTDEFRQFNGTFSSSVSFTNSCTYSPC